MSAVGIAMACSILLVGVAPAVAADQGDMEGMDAQNTKLGIGGLGSVYRLPDALTPYYGSHPVSFMLFVRVKID
jgi:hypothetical protein